MWWFKKKHRYKKVKGNGNTIICNELPSNKFTNNSKLIIHGDGNEVNVADENTYYEAKITILGNNNKVTLGKSDGKVDVYLVANNCCVEIGDNNSFGDCEIDLHENNSRVIIGNDGLYARQSMIFCTDFHSVIDFETKKPLNQGKEVVFGNHVWLGIGVKVLKNVRIVDDVIISTGSIVTKSLDKSHSVYAGNPATLKKENISWVKDIYDIALAKYEAGEG